MLKVKNLSVGYKNRILLENLTFEIHSGEIFAIIGPNGSGKSSLMKTLLNFTQALTGQVFMGSKEIQYLEGKEKSLALSYLHREDKSHLDLFVEEYVLLGRLPHRSWKDWFGFEQDQFYWVEKSIEYIGCKHLKNRLCHELSDGEWQLIQFARCLAQQSQVILADEPVAHLDLIQRKRFHSLIQKYVKEENKSICLITHELDLALQYADQILVLDGQGKFVLGQPKDQKVYDFIESLFEIDYSI